VTEVVVEVGPAALRGPGDVPAESVAAALECIDDPFALVDDQPVAVDRLWGEVLATAAGTTAASVVLVCPTWWSQPRTELVCAAAHSVAAEAMVLSRSEALRAGRAATVVEIAPDLVLASRGRDDLRAIARVGDPQDVAQAVAGAVDASATVLVDAPAGVEGAAALAAAITARVRAAGATGSIVDAGWVLRAAAALRADQRRAADVVETPPAVRNPRGRAVLAGAPLSVAAVCVGFAAQGESPTAPPEVVPMTLLVEGRVGVKVPALWTVQRVLSGPGSARIQVVSPSDRHTALHITQAPLPAHTTPAAVAQTLREALDEQPAGVFVDFNPADTRAEKPVVTYREVRPRHHIAWAVLVEDSVRIGIGCQSAPEHDQSVTHACDEAIRSAHAVFSKMPGTE
jgi:type VII secretion-associated protein (TIGR03931 family)